MMMTLCRILLKKKNEIIFVKDIKTYYNYEYRI